jgi:hypothetical protein
MSYADWLKHKRSPEEIEAAWQCARHDGERPPLSLSDLPGEAPTPLASAEPCPPPA